jgi:DNA-binding NarL/FixJ family response regulator
MRILIVDDHALVRRGMNYVVKEGFPDADVVEAESSAAALEALRAGGKVDIALVDVRMPDLDGLELLRAIKGEWADMPVIMLSTYENAPYVKRALADGAAGYLLKDATPEDLSQAINVAMSGSGNVLSPRVIQNLFEDQEASNASSSNGRRSEYSLTQREHDILALLAEGRSPVPVGEDRQGTPRRDLPQARRHEPHTGRDDGRADGRRPGPGRAAERLGQLPKSR